MTRPPDTHALADQLITLGRTLRDHGQRTTDLAHQLAARGYPATTLGDGTRSADRTSSTERTALAGPNRWANVDRLLAVALGQLADSVDTVDRLVTQIRHHADDVDPIPAGSGECQACDTVVRHNPLKDENNRLRSGLCRSDFGRWDRHRKAHPGAHLPDWIRARRQELGLPERIILGAAE